MKSISSITKSAKSIVAVRRTRPFLIPKSAADADIDGVTAFANGSIAGSFGMGALVVVTRGSINVVENNIEIGRDGWPSPDGLNDTDAPEP